MGEKFRLNFMSDDFGVVEIDEPIGFNTISFDVAQKEKGYGRDIFFNDGEAQLEFTNFRNHFLDKLLYYFHYFGFEAKVQLEIEFLSGETTTMDLDFKSAMTDDLEYFKCKCIEVSEVQIIKRRSSVKVDLFATNDIDGNSIEAIPTIDVLLQPKQMALSSEWTQAPFNNVLSRSVGSENTVMDWINPCANIVKSEINDTLSWFELKTTSPEGFYIIQAKDNMTDVKVSIEDMVIDFTTDVDNGGNGYVDMKFVIAYGAEWGTANKQTLLSTIKTEGQSFSYDSTIQGNFNVNIPALNREDKVWVYFEYKVRQSASTPTARFEVFTTIQNMKTFISANTKSFYSTTTGIRLIDAVKQVVKSISGLELNAPLIDVGSLYYDTVLFNGNLLRGLIDKPFYLSLDDIQNSLGSEANGDFETGSPVFFGNEREFYTSEEIWFFDNTQFSEFSKKVNDRFAINQFSFNYKNFQSQKENEEKNTIDIIHGECKMTLANKMVENRKEISVDWIRDSFLIEEARRKSIEISEDTSAQDDDKLFAIDTVINPVDRKFKETANLFHDYNVETGYLTLRSKDEPNFKLLGLGFGDDFIVKAPDSNAGTYLIQSIFENYIELYPKFITTPLLGTVALAYPNENNDGARVTTFEYYLHNEDFPLTNRTIEEITNISGVSAPDSYSNLRFSIRRDIENNYSEYLSTCNIYRKETPLKVTYYKNNRDCTFTYNGTTTLEGSDYLPNNPILSPWIYENAIFANVSLEDFVTIRNSLKSERGFIRCIDKTGNVIKLYPKKMSYENLSKELNILGEAKYEPSQMTISDTTGVIIINDETTLVKINYKIENDKLYVYDSNRQLLYNGVFWDKVSINGGFADSITELDELMKLL